MSSEEKQSNTVQGEASDSAGSAFDTPEARALRKLTKLEVGEDLKLPDQAEDDIALFFTALHGEDRRFVQKWGRWLYWDGMRWQFDDTVSTYDLVRICCRERAKLVCIYKGNERLAAAIASAKTVAGVEKLARSDRRTAAHPDQFDVDPMLVNTPAGTVDLRRGGQMREHRREDLITKITAVAPDHDADDSTWQRFLDAITLGRRELQEYLQRLFGLCLTGDTRDHILPFFLGSGANGKSTLLELMQYISGDYARQVPSEVLMEARGERHPTDIANLMGVRLAVASEVDEGHTWAESRIKSLTGDTTFTARFMRRDYFTFRRTHKLIVAGNHRPTLRVVDEAMKRRIHLVPFEAHFLGDQVDPDMPRKLRTQAPAVLAWAIRGALDWQANGLSPPQEVTYATQEYFVSQDTLGLWIAECCDTSLPGTETGSRELYQAYHTWKERRGEKPPSERRFSDQLEQRFRKERRAGIARFQGIRLRAPEAPSEAKQ